MRYLSSISLALIVLMALACSHSLVEEDPGTADAYFQKGQNLIDEAVRTKSDGTLEYSHALHTKAIAAFNKALFRDFRHYEARSQRALAYLVIGEYQLAVNDLDMLIESYYALDHNFHLESYYGVDHAYVEPDNKGLVANYITRGHAYEFMGEYAKARDDYIKICELATEMGESGMCKPGIIERMGILAGE